MHRHPLNNAATTATFLYMQTLAVVVVVLVVVLVVLAELVVVTHVVVVEVVDIMVAVVVMALRLIKFLYQVSLHDQRQAVVVGRHTGVGRCLRSIRDPEVVERIFSSTVKPRSKEHSHK
jgi:hypothetical protein